MANVGRTLKSQTTNDDRKGPQRWTCEDCSQSTPLSHRYLLMLQFRVPSYLPTTLPAYP